VNDAELRLEDVEDCVHEKLGKPTLLKKLPHINSISAYMLSKSPLKYRGSSARQKRVHVVVMISLARGNLAFALVNQFWFRE
jgi:hypothetical protein